MIAVVGVTAWMWPHPLTSLPFLAASLATSLPFLAAFATHNTKRQVSAPGKSA